MNTLELLENEIETLQESIACGADGSWETIVLLHDQLIKCLKLHAKLTGNQVAAATTTEVKTEVPNSWIRHNTQKLNRRFHRKIKSLSEEW